MKIKSLEWMQGARLWSHRYTHILHLSTNPFIFHFLCKIMQYTHKCLHIFIQISMMFSLIKANFIFTFVYPFRCYVDAHRVATLPAKTFWHCKYFCRRGFCFVLKRINTQFATREKCKIFASKTKMCQRQIFPK